MSRRFLSAFVGLLFPQIAAAQQPLLTRGDFRLAAGFAAATLAVAPFDADIARAVRGPGVQSSGGARHTAAVFNSLGDPGTVVLAATLYGMGRLARIERMADLGLHSGEAVVASGIVTGAIKALAGRERPSSAGTSDPEDFAFGHGFAGNAFASFPSGHTTAAFATATIMTLEASRWWPRSTRYVAPLMFGTATLVGAARVYTNAHWASDVVMGAGIGTLTGLAVFRHSHADTQPRLERWLLRALPTVTPAPGGRRGIALGWSAIPWHSFAPALSCLPEPTASPP